GSRGCRGLLAREDDREFAVADAPGKPFGVIGSRFLAVGRYELDEGSKQRGLRHAVPVDPIEAPLCPGFLDVTERDPFLLMIRDRLAVPDRACQRCHGVPKCDAVGITVPVICTLARSRAVRSTDL